MAHFPLELRRTHLKVAEVHFTRKPEVIETVLGSCIGAVLWSPKFRAGAMCHGALPRCPGNCLQLAPLPHKLRYVDFAIRYMAEKLSRLGLDEDLEARLFGGAELLKFSTGGGHVTVGRQNTEVALETLEKLNVPLASSDLGGSRGRVIYFRTDTGEVYLRRLPDRMWDGVELNGHHKQASPK